MKFHRHQDLEIGFTSSFELQWTDKGSGASRDGAYWRPVLDSKSEMAAPNELGKVFKSVGDLGQSNYGDANGKAMSVMVRQTNDPGNAHSDPPVKPPTGFELVWTDHGSGADMDGSMWYPVPPDGYVTMGLVCNKGYEEPKIDPANPFVVCVRKDLVIPANVGEPIWGIFRDGVSSVFSKASHPVGYFLSSEICPPIASPGKVYFSPGTFIGHRQAADENIYALQLRLDEPSTPSSNPPRPQLDNYDAPSLYAKDTSVSQETLPWFAVKDPGLSRVQQMNSSPNYTMKRLNKFKLISHAYNDTVVEQTHEWKYTVGTSVEKTKAFSSTTGIELGVKSNFPGGEVSVTLSQSFTFTEENKESWSETTERTIPSKVPPKTAVAAYNVESSYTLHRQNGEQVGETVISNGYQIVWVQYPKHP